MYIDMAIVPLERHCYRVAKCTGCLKQVSFRKRASKYRALLQKMTSKDKASYSSSTLRNAQDALNWYLSAKEPLNIMYM